MRRLERLLAIPGFTGEKKRKKRTSEQNRVPRGGKVLVCVMKSCKSPEWPRRSAATNSAARPSKVKGPRICFGFSFDRERSGWFSDQVHYILALMRAYDVGACQARVELALALTVFV